MQRVMVFRQLRLDAVNRAAITLDGAAGKAVNVAKVLRVLGEEACLTGFVGGPRGDQLLELLSPSGITLDFVKVEAPTRQCLTMIDESTGAITELVEESRPVEAAAYAQLLAVAARRIPGSCALVMSGTLTSGGPADFYARCAGLAHEHGVLTVADASGAALREVLKTRPGLVKPNRQELEATVGRQLDDELALLAAMRELQAQGARRVVITNGKAPALAYDGHSAWRILPPRVKSLNPIGSGDAFTAGLVWRLLHGDDLGQACRWGAATGAANALTLMVGEVPADAPTRLVEETVVQQIRS